MSRAQQMLGFVYIALTILFTVGGQLLIKAGVDAVGARPAQQPSTLLFILRAFTHPLVAAGLGCALAGAVCWTLALSRVALSLAYPFMGLAIVLVLALSPLLLREAVPWTRWLGVAIVCVGLWLTARR